MNRCQEIERSIIKKFRPTLWHPFVKAINNYKLIDENDKIAVCISGGKDSFLLAKCLEELQKHGKIKFDLEYIIMNPGYTDEVLDKIKNNLKLLNLVKRKILVIYVRKCVEDIYIIMRRNLDVIK